MAIRTDGNIRKDPNSSTNQDINTPDIDGGTIDGATLGATNIYGQYKTIYIPAAAMAPTSTNGATGGTYEYTTQDISYDYMAFDGATEQFACFAFPAPGDWNLGTIKYKVFWSSATSSTAADKVEWELQGGAVTDSDAIDTALGTAQVVKDVLLADNGGDMQLSPASAALTIAGTPAAGDLLVFKISRNVGSDDDNMTENAWLFGVWIQYLTSVAPTTW